MKVYRVHADRCDWDQYRECIVVAESAQAIIDSIICDEKYKTHEIHVGDDYVSFDYNQGEIHIDEIDLSKESIICRDIR